jgi:hypothetical protein
VQAGYPHDRQKKTSDDQSAQHRRSKAEPKPKSYQNAVPAGQRVSQRTL